jgi:hypothetical protein
MIPPDELPHAARSLATCVENGSWEDAHQWCLEILAALHQRAKLEAADLKQKIERLGFRRIDPPAEE